MIYKICYAVAYFLTKLMFNFKVYGKQNVTNDKPLLVCANHTHTLDFLFIAFAMGKNANPSFMAKKEVFKIKALNPFLKSLGIFPIDRGAADIAAIKKSLSILKSGGKLVIFPEGTRVKNPEDNIDAKAGAGMLAMRSEAYILPVYIQPEKKLFKNVKIIVGKPYKQNKPENKPTTDDYLEFSNQIMQQIKKLSKEN